MSRRPLRFKQTDLVRAIKAAEQAGPDWGVVVDNDGTIRVVKTYAQGSGPQEGGVFDDRPPMVF